jgi:hypothetical protein
MIIGSELCEDIYSSIEWMVLKLNYIYFKMLNYPLKEVCDKLLKGFRIKYRWTGNKQFSSWFMMFQRTMVLSASKVVQEEIPWTLKMRALCKTPGATNLITQCHIPEDLIRRHHCEVVSSHSEETNYIA